MPFSKVPEFPVPELTRWLADFDRRLEEDRNTKLSKITANASLLLQTPLGKVYEVKMSEAGTLTITLISSSPP